MYSSPGNHARYQREPVNQTQAQHDAGIATLVTPFTQTHLGVPNINGPNSSLVGTNQYPVNPNQFFCTADGQIVYIPSSTAIYPATTINQPSVPDAGYGSYPSSLPYGTPSNFPGYMPAAFPMLAYSPRHGYYDRSDVMHKDVPSLENRRGSYSTNESAPRTPFYGSFGHRGPGTHIATIDRSPIYSTPSPEQLPHAAVPAILKGNPYRNSSGVEIDQLLLQQPAIPQAVPAVFTPRENLRTLEQSLANPIFGNRNVYIRGLHPHTDDDTLAAYAARFGRVETSKAIIDTSTGACKGFGFAKYFDVRDSELCIRGFFKLGYEVGFARESFNSRLKAEGDDNSTNLYVSNLPRSMTEAELGAIFMEYTVSSSRILRDTQGQSRGVGFARFESREVCEEIIKKFHGQPIGEEGLLLQVRYADTPAQKDLKRITTERRHFRTAEYNAVAYAAPADLIALAPTVVSPVGPRMAQIARHLPATRKASSSNSWKPDLLAANISSKSPSTTIVQPHYTIGNVIFKDLDVGKVKSSSPPTAEGATLDQPETSTPSVSEDDSEDEGVTIQCLSPAAAREKVVTTPLTPEKIIPTPITAEKA